MLEIYNEDVRDLLTLYDSSNTSAKSGGALGSGSGDVGGVSDGAGGSSSCSGSKLEIRRGQDGMIQVMKWISCRARCEYCEMRVKFGLLMSRIDDEETFVACMLAADGSTREHAHFEGMRKRLQQILQEVLYSSC